MWSSVWCCDERDQARRALRGQTVSTPPAPPENEGLVPEGISTQRIIATGFTLVLLLLAVITTLGLTHMATNKVRMANLVTESNVKIESVFLMRSLSRERFASLGQMVVLRDPFERDEEFMRFQAQAAEFIQARDRLLALGMRAEEQVIWERAREWIRRDERLHDRVIELAMADQRDAALAMLLNEVRPVEKALLVALTELIEQYRLANQQALRAAEHDYREAAAYMLGLAGVALALGLIIAWMVMRRSHHAEAKLSRQTKEAVAAAEHLSWAASHDSLTGLSNRREVQRRLHELIVDTKMHRTPHTLLYVDLDRFKTVNDRCGHLAGDALLRQLAGLFKRHVRNGDLVARLGGDEFCVGLVNCQSEQALRIAEAIRAEIEQHRFVWEGQEFDVGASIGLVEIDASMDVERALQAADAACYRAKEQGRSRVCVH